MLNPFKYGREVSGRQFYDRQEAFDSLYSKLAGGSANVVMYAPRRYGKTSLVKKVLGPIFIPMLYHVNSSLTAEVVCAAYRTADPCTNIVTPVMTYVGVILLYCRRYIPNFAVGNLLFMMVPYSAVFLVVATTVMIAWFKLGIPFGF